MNQIVLLAETGSDIPKETAAQYGIRIVPMHVSFGAETRDDGTFPPEEVCRYYERTRTLPTTSGSVPADFIRSLSEIRRENPDCGILYMAYSASTTCSYQSAAIAIEEMDLKNIACVDTKQVSAGQGIAVIEMAKRLAAHPEWSLAEAASEAEAVSRSVRMCFVPDTLEFLRAGGRVSNAAAIAGTLLKLHPVIEIQDGRLVATKKCRGKMSRIAASLVGDYIRAHSLRSEELFLIHAPGFSQEAMQAAEESAAAAGVKKIAWIPTGGVITCHGGPGAFGIAGFSS